MKTLFSHIVDPSKLNKGFIELKHNPSYLPARWMADHIFQSFDDPEGNFLEQFQTGGFNSRLFELYLFAYFFYAGFHIDRNHVNPDFLVSYGGQEVAVEATTTNPSTSGALSALRKKVSELSDKELREYLEQELPIRFGSPIFSKLKKKYWELDHCKDLPFVIAIEAFHEDESLALSESALANYLYGLEEKVSWDQEGKVHIQSLKIADHQVGDKMVSSHFFSQQDTEQVSAILFTNCGTISKFARMGYQYGIGVDEIYLVRTGRSYNKNASSFDPTFFSFSLDDAPFVEPWGDGLVVLHNPNCLRPVPHGFFPNAVDLYLEEDKMAADVPGWHTISSKTIMLRLDRTVKVLKHAPLLSRNRWAIVAISPQEYREITRTEYPPISFGQEHGWFTDEARAFLGVVVQDHTDGDWGYLVLARDEKFLFRAIDVIFNFPSRDRAVVALHLKLLERLESPKRIFIQDML